MFIYKALMKIDYFKQIDYPFFHSILYKMKMRYLEKGDILLKELDDTDALFIVEYGHLEIFTEFEGNEFIVDKLPPGSVLNHHVVFTEDNMVTNIRATCTTYINELHENDFEELQESEPLFKKRMMMY